jgi:hypothetical protein
MEFTSDSACLVCPTRTLKAGEFVFEQPDSRSGYGFDKERKVRTNPEGTPACVHPERFGAAALALVKGAETSQEERAPLELTAPEQEEEVHAWASAILASVPDERVFSALAYLEEEITRVYSAPMATAVCRAAFQERVS